MQKELRSVGSLILLSLLTVVACTFESQVRMTILTHQTNVNSKIGIVRCHVVSTCYSPSQFRVAISYSHIIHSLLVWHYRFTLALNDDCKKQEVFVRRKVEEIHKLIDVDCWYHVESKLVPPAILSRGLWFFELIDNDLWFKRQSTILLDVFRCLI